LADGWGVNGQGRFPARDHPRKRLRGRRAPVGARAISWSRPRRPTFTITPIHNRVAGARIQAPVAHIRSNSPPRRVASLRRPPGRRNPVDTFGCRA